MVVSVRPRDPPLPVFDLHVLFGHRESVVPDRLGELHLGLDLLHQDLPPRGVRTRESHLLPSPAHVGNDEDRELEIGHEAIIFMERSFVPQPHHPAAGYGRRE